MHSYILQLELVRCWAARALGLTSTANVRVFELHTTIPGPAPRQARAETIIAIVGQHDQRLMSRIDSPLHELDRDQVAFTCSHFDYLPGVSPVCGDSH